MLYLQSAQQQLHDSMSTFRFWRAGHTIVGLVKLLELNMRRLESFGDVDVEDDGDDTKNHLYHLLDKALMSTCSLTVRTP